MDVGGAIIDRVQQHLLNEFNDRCVVDLLGCCIVRLASCFLVKEVEVDVVGGEIPEGIFGGLRILGNQRHQLLVFDNDGVNAQAGLKADFIQRAEIGRVGNRHGESISPSVQRNDAVGS